MEIKKVASDNRGDVHAFEMGDKIYTIVSFAPDIYRGGHFHKTSQWHTCVSGNLFVKLINPHTKQEECRMMTEGVSVLIPAGVPHLFKAIDGEAVMVESRVGEYEATDYEPYRKLARPK